MLKRYEPVVSTEHLSIDYVVYWLLLSVLHPINTWVLSLPMCYLTNDIRFVGFSIFVSLAHLLSHWNENYKQRGNGVADLEGEKYILITGGSKGLGLEIVENSLKWLKIGKIFIIDVIEPRYKNDKVVFFRCDVSNSDMLDSVINQILEENNIDVLINNAGVRHDKALNELSTLEIDKVFLVNTTAVVQLARRLTSQRSLRRLHVVTISSILGTIGPRNLSIYSASKAATILIHESLSYELKLKKEIDFRFSLFLPGQLNTDMFKDVHVPHNFLAPVIDANKLSLKIIEILKQGKQGIYCFPFYANFVPLLKSLPFGLYEFLRWYSGMDEQIVPIEENEFVMID